MVISVLEMKPGALHMLGMLNSIPRPPVIKSGTCHQGPFPMALSFNLSSCGQALFVWELT